MKYAPFDAMSSIHGLLSKSALVCVLAFPAVSRAFNPVIDYQMTGTMVIESAGAKEEVAAEMVTIPKALSPYPSLIFKPSVGVFNFLLNETSVTVGSSLAEGRTFAPAWKQASVERVNTGNTVPLRCQSVNVDGTFIRDNARKPNEIREEGVAFPDRQGPAAGTTLMNCNVHNIGRLFDSGLPFGAELTRKPLAVRLANPGSTLCLNVPGELDAQPLKVRICVTGLAASARISYH